MATDLCLLHTLTPKHFEAVSESNRLIQQILGIPRVAAAED